MIKKIKSNISLFRDYIIREFLLYFPSHDFRRWILKHIIKKIGKNTWFLMGVEVRNGENISIGNNCAINKNVLLDGRGGQLVIGNNVDIAQETNIWTLSHDVNSDTHDDKGGDVTINDFVWIASRVTILPGINIGKGAVIAAGSVVTKDVPEMVVAGGVPARILGERKSKLKYLIDYKPKFR